MISAMHQLNVYRILQYIVPFKRNFDESGLIVTNRRNCLLPKIVGSLINNFLKLFFNNLSRFSDEHGERFHQDIATIEQRFKGENISHMLGEYCWSICRKNIFFSTRKTHVRFFSHN